MMKYLGFVIKRDLLLSLILLEHLIANSAWSMAPKENGIKNLQYQFSKLL